MELKDTKGIRAALIIEVLGKPREALIEKLEEIISEIDKEKGVSVRAKMISDPEPVKERPDLYTSFADIEIEVEDLIDLAVVIFKYMPANVEVISPELIGLTNTSWTDILSEIVRRLHKYEEIARFVQMENAILEKKLRAVLEPKNVNTNAMPVILTSNLGGSKKTEEKKENKKPAKDKKKKK